MDGQKVLKYALNIADLMKKASALLGDPGGQPEETIVGRSRSRRSSSEDRIDQESLEAIGLDDTGIMAIIIELSQDRSNFKIWTPYSEEFNTALKREVPKGARKFDWDERCWRIDIDWFGNAQHLIVDHYPDIDRRYTDRAIRMCAAISEQQQEDEESSRQHTRHSRQQEHDDRARSAYNRYKETARRTNESAHREYEKARRKTDASYDKTWDNWDDEPNGNDPYKVLGVLPDAPDEVVKAAHKAQARKHHTDLGGDGVMMSKINVAYETIGRERGWKT